MNEMIMKELKRIEMLISQKQNDNEEFIGIDEVTRITGLKKNTIYAYHKNQELPSYRFGDRALRFKRAEVIGWMNERITKNEKD